MGKIIDTSNDISPIIASRPTFEKNGNKDNFYNKMLQCKINQDWNYRNNIYTVGEENIFGSLNFNEIDVVMKSVYDDKNVKLADDFKSLTFKDIKHHIGIGRRYKFSVDKEYNDNDDLLNIWMVVNLESISSTATAVVKRCNNCINMLVDNNTRIHSEPCIIDPTIKYVNMYHNDDVTISQASLYFVMQNNQYTKDIKINDRFIIGQKNVYKVKSVNDYLSNSTFDRDGNPLIILSVDKDTEKQDDDNFELGITNANNYKPQIITDDIYIDIDNLKETLYLYQENTVTCKLISNNIEVVSDIDYTILSGEEGSYGILKDQNNFIISNHKYNKTPLIIRFYTTYNDTEYYKDVEIKLRGLV